MALPACFAVISDIHGNIDALRAVLADIDRRGIGLILNLGDHFSGPLAAGETAALLASREMVAIRGNHDRWLVELPPDRQSASEAMALPQLGRRDLDWLRGLPATLDLEGEVFLCHGTPGNDEDYLLEEVCPDGRVLPVRSGRAQQLVAGVECGLILCGHTHRARRMDLPDGRVILNPGSVGCPGYVSDTPFPHVMEAASPAASYAIVESCAAGWATQICAVPYDSRRMAALARDSLRPGWVPFLEQGCRDPA